ncbi:terminase small subunit [Paraburkholderia tropica]|uniref:terminase small subunit n=1 Tax=Paraburkholderia tropica TaxID=92647 RepID=UPI002AB090FE|nr:terminase small subunit [Paraburkholderia tropica]
MEPDDEKIRSRADDIENKPDNRGDVLPTFPEHTGAEFRLGKERVSGLDGDIPLSFQEETFVRAYFQNGFNHRDAAQRARIPYQSVARMIRKPNVRAAMDRIQREASAELKISQHLIVADLYEMFTANLADVVEHRRGACRFCWGDDGKFHWRTEREREQADAVPPNSKKRPTESDPTRGQSDGGTGYDEYAIPNPECLECAGQGLSIVLLKDTVGKKGVQAVEYAPNGKITVKGYDKAKIGEMLLKHLSMVQHDEAHKVTNSGPVININGGIPPEFLAALKDKGGLAALESFIEKDGAGRVAQLEAAATDEEQAEIDALIAKGEHLE